METTKTLTFPHYLKQYAEMKARHPDALMLFRVGDFYETYYEDAKAASAILGITLTKVNGTKTPLAGFPSHCLDGYLMKLVCTAHRRVAICEQLEEPATRKLAKQDITTNH